MPADRHFACRTRCAGSRLLVLGALAWLCGIDPAQAQGISIEVTTDQRVSISGRGPSLRTVVEDVCYRAGIDVLSYDAGDRPYGGSYVDLPAAALLQRLLREESFLVESVLVGETERVTTIRVLGDPAVAAARRARGEGGRRARFHVPPILLDTAFATETADEAQQEAALATLGARIAGDPGQLQGFLSTDSRLIAQALQRRENVEGSLRELQRRYPDPRVTAKIDEIVGELAKLPPLPIP